MKPLFSLLIAASLFNIGNAKTDDYFGDIYQKPQWGQHPDSVGIDTEKFKDSVKSKLKALENRVAKLEQKNSRWQYDQ